MTNMTETATTPVSKPKARPRPQVMKLTDAAAQRVLELMKRADSEIIGLRVGVKNGGCAGGRVPVRARMSPVCCS